MELNPPYTAAHYNLGSLLLKLGGIAGAPQDFANRRIRAAAVMASTAFRAACPCWRVRQRRQSKEQVDTDQVDQGPLGGGEDSRATKKTHQ
jgi:hypothetical protein